MLRTAAIHYARRGILVVCAVALGTAAVAVSTAAPAGATGPPSLSVSPSASGLTDGALVQVSGSNLPAGTNQLAECTTAGCDTLNTGVAVSPDSLGTLGSTPYTVHQHITVNGSPVDCASAGCAIAALGGPVPPGGFPPFAAISFGSGPPPPPPSPLMVTPNSGLSDGEHVSVSGYTTLLANTSYQVDECRGQSGVQVYTAPVCDATVALTATTDSSGLLSTSYAVHQNITVNGAPVNCAFTPCVVAIIGAPLYEPINFAAGGPPGGFLMANPFTGLHDGEVITVSGAGFAPSAAVNLYECTPANAPLSLALCDPSTQTPATAGTTGTFAVPFTARQTITTADSGTITCVTQAGPGPGTCFIVAVPFNGAGGFAQINFAAAPPATVSGTVTGPNGVALPSGGVAACPANETLSATCAGFVGTGTDASGHYTLSLAAGSYNLVGYAFINNQIDTSTPPLGLTVTAGETITENFVVTLPTTLAYSGPTQGDLGDPVAVSASLHDVLGNPVSGELVSFALGSATCSGISTNGTATCTLVPTGAAGPATLTASLAADANYLASGASSPFTITPEQTVSSYTGPTSAGNGTVVQLQGQLLSDDGTPVVGSTITLSLGTQSCTATTDATGTGTCSITVSQPLGPVSATASFAGDSSYLPSQSSAVSGFVFASSNGGSFVIGDQNASINNAVTFWGAQWAKDNGLSGGSAPNSFKGFADTPTTAPTCSTQWSTRPGNSSGPPDRVPTYMAVIVTSSATKSGSTISGNTTKLVIVKTDPGYAANPGHAGTGTVVAILPCS